MVDHDCTAVPDAIPSKPGDGDSFCVFKDDEYASSTFPSTESPIVGCANAEIAIQTSPFLNQRTPQPL